MTYLSKQFYFRISSDDEILINDLKKYDVKPSQFIRLAMREKMKRDYPKLIEDEEKRKSKEKCPF